MNQGIRITARKELRAFFLSPVALIFLGVFLAATCFQFFTGAKFFARGLADARPMFESLPILLVLLVAAVTMRQWSEEQKMGTLEVLMTLPVRTADLVLGKFLAALALIAVALLLTLPLPISVSMLGELDWGPVIGGYIAALLLASTYIAIGLCVSALTDNQNLALMGTVVVCAVLYAIGSEDIAGLFGHSGAEIARALGTGSRFDSIERGVLDVRDLFYYGSLTAFFVALNVYVLETKRMESRSSKRAWLTMVVLTLLNVVAGNAWLYPVTQARADLTADGEYSISDVTENMLRDLDEPLVLTGYFSEKTHHLLAPLVPRIRDFLREYEVRGGENVTVRFIDPTKDEQVEEEINEQYGIKSEPLAASGRHEQSVVNSYFHVLVQYGSAYEVLGFRDLIEVHADDKTLSVRLRNPEYDITKSIKKVSQDFQSIEAVLARAKDGATLTAYVSTANLPKEFEEVPKRLRTVADELIEKSGGTFKYVTQDPAADEALAREIAQKYGFRPMAADLFGENRFYMHLVLEVGGKASLIFPQGDMSEADIRGQVEAAVKRGVPGFLKTVGILTEEQQAQQPNPMMQQMGMPPPKKADYRSLERSFRADFEVKRVKLDDGVVPADIDVLLVGKAGKLEDKQRFAIDQYLMRGGALVVMAGAYDIEPGRAGITAKKTDPGLLELLEAYGVEVQEAFVMDPKNTSFPVPVREKRGPFTFERIELIPYPFFPDIRREGFNREHVALAGLQSVALTWASPLKIKGAAEGVSSDVLLETSEESWLRTSTDLQPDLQRFPDKGFGVDEGAELGRKPVAVALAGTFGSYFAEKDSPLFEPDAKPEGDLEQKADRTGRTLKKSTPDARLAVIGSSDFVSDLITQLGAQVGGGTYRGNPMLLRNLVDWALEDTQLLSIRNAGAFARTLESTDEASRWRYELGNYLFVLLALIGVLVIALTRRKMARPMELTPEEKA